VKDRDLIAKAVTQGLFGEDALVAPAEASVPDRYEVVRCLGRGGFGVVYLANDRELERPVALKVLASASPADVERLRREARFTARLESPHIVSVHDLGEHEGQAFIAMKFIDGGNLAQATLARDVLLRTMATVARALQVAHAQGIVHRDVKPENILLDKEGRPYLTDFGIARDLRSQEQKTQEGIVVGTPALMSPEQARGEPRSVDARTDIYGLGATLYSLLLGRAPFQGASVVDVLHAIIHDPPEKPRSIDATIPQPLEDLLLRCLQKDKRDRYPSMDDVARDLDAIAAGATGATHAPPRVTTPGELDWSGALEAAAEIAWWDANRYRVARDLPRTYPRLDALVTRLDGILARRPDTGWARFYRGVALARRGRLEAALEDMERSIDSLSDHATAHFELGRLYLELSLKDHEEAHKHLSHVGAEPGLHATRSRLEQAVVAFREAERLREGLPAWQIASVKAVARLAQRDAVGCIEECDAILARDPEAEDVWKLKGDAERLAHRDPIPSYDRALEIRRSFHEALFAKALAQLEARRIADARSSLARVLEIDPELPGARVLLARTYLAEEPRTEGALDEALKQIERALQSAPALYDALVTRAQLEIARERLARSEAWSERALATLARAREADGCQNRVALLESWARVERARTRVASGRDPSADLDEVVRLATGENAHVPDNEPWLEVLAEAKALRGRAGH